MLVSADLVSQRAAPEGFYHLRGRRPEYTLANVINLGAALPHKEPVWPSYTFYHYTLVFRQQNHNAKKMGEAHTQSSSS